VCAGGWLAAAPACAVSCQPSAVMSD
jgi:hypothetical protein